MGFPVTDVRLVEMYGSSYASLYNHCTATKGHHFGRDPRSGYAHKSGSDVIDYIYLYVHVYTCIIIHLTVRCK